MVALLLAAGRSMSRVDTDMFLGLFQAWSDPRLSLMSVRAKTPVVIDALQGQSRSRLWWSYMQWWNDFSGGEPATGSLGFGSLG